MRICRAITSSVLNETWISIPGYEGLYWASSFGRIMGHHGWRIKAQGTDRSIGGLLYKKVDLYKNGKRKTFRVNRLILMAFRGIPPEKSVARHIDDENTFNNRLDNLKWGTQSQNISDFYHRKEEAEHVEHQLQKSN